MFIKLCPWCGYKAYSSRFKKSCPNCKNKISMSIIWIPCMVMYLVLMGLMFSSTQLINEILDFLIILFPILLFVGLVPNKRRFSIFDDMDKLLQKYKLTKFKAQIVWIPRYDGGLFLPKIFVVRTDVFAIEKTNVKNTDNSDHATFVILKKFTFMRRDEAIFEYLLSCTLDDEFYLTYKGRKVAKCTVTERL